MKKNNSDLVEVSWNDAKYWHNGNISTEMPKMWTVGFILNETNEYILVEKQLTINTQTLQFHPKEKVPKYYYIPKGMIENLEKIDAQNPLKRIKSIVEKRITDKDPNSIVCLEVIQSHVSGLLS